MFEPECTSQERLCPPGIGETGGRAGPTKKAYNFARSTHADSQYLLVEEMDTCAYERR